jgi:hypothetical protein
MGYEIRALYQAAFFDDQVGEWQEVTPQSSLRTTRPFANEQSRT